MIKLDLTINEINATLLALAKLPYETVAPLIEKIRNQSIPQVPAAEEAERKAQLQSDLISAVQQPEVVDAENV